MGNHQPYRLRSHYTRYHKSKAEKLDMLNIWDRQGCILSRPIPRSIPRGIWFLQFVHHRRWTNVPDTFDPSIADYWPDELAGSSEREEGTGPVTHGGFSRGFPVKPCRLPRAEPSLDERIVGLQRKIVIFFSIALSPITVRTGRARCK